MEWITVTPLCNPVIPPVQIQSDSVRPRNAPVKSRSAQTKSRAAPVHTSDTQASAIATSAPSGAPLALPLPGNAGEGGGERLAEQPMRMQRLAQLPR